MPFSAIGVGRERCITSFEHSLPRERARNIALKTNIRPLFDILALIVDIMNLIEWRLRGRECGIPGNRHSLP